jgi:hypothetical protein
MTPFAQFITQNNLTQDDPTVMKKDSTILAAREMTSQPYRHVVQKQVSAPATN